MTEVIYSDAALKTLRKSPKPVGQRIREKIALYASDPAALANNVAALKGYQNTIRLRVGDWRVLIRERDGALLVIDVTPRGKDYKP